MYVMNEETGRFINELYRNRNKLLSYGESSSESNEANIMWNELEVRSNFKKKDAQHRYEINFIHNPKLENDFDKIYEYETPDEIKTIEENEDFLYAATFDEALNKAWRAFKAYYDYLKGSGKLAMAFSPKRLEKEIDTAYTSYQKFSDFRTALWESIEIVDTIGNDGITIDVRHWMDIYMVLDLMDAQPKKKAIRNKKVSDKNEYGNVQETK